MGKLISKKCDRSELNGLDKGDCTFDRSKRCAVFSNKLRFFHQQFRQSGMINVHSRPVGRQSADADSEN